MYRPPQNSNRVKLIRTKFENVECNKSPERKNVKNRNRSYLNSNPIGKRDAKEETNKQLLQRQVSDPTRRNIKRTPAFRVDKSLDRTSGFQRNGLNSNQSTLFETKIKQFSAVKNNCDINSNPLSKEKSERKSLLVNSKKVPMLIKSNSSLELKYVENECDKNITSSVCNNCHDSTNNSNADKSLDLSLLYTEPIPKALRRNNSNCTDILTSSVTNETFGTIHNASTLKIDEKLGDMKKKDPLTDTLKVALSKPLPKGPAPKKPPRAFQVPSKDDPSSINKNSSFLHDFKSVEKKPLITSSTKLPLHKSDPKYMLIKLEDALRNNKLRAKRHPKVDISLTSGEDSDDSLISRTKSNRTLPRLPCQQDDCDYSDNSAFNFNCLNGFKLGLANYEKIKEPNSCFFISSPVEEPVYAEPYHYHKDSFDSGVFRREGSSRSKQSARNSLYYMSTPLLSAGGTFFHNMTESADKQISAENSSLSSFTSDADTPSPIDESPKIRSIIECYESRNSSQLQNGQTANTNRLDDLKISLRETLDKSFNNICAIKDTDSENECKVSDIIKKFETYRQTMPKYCSTKITKEKLFYCCLIIEKVKDMARIKYKYPPNAEIPLSIENLCFPESEGLNIDMSNLSQNYSLLVTNDKGERTFGYCRRVLPEGSTCCLPLAYCILSKYRAPRFYKKILVEFESRHGLPNRDRDELISQFYDQKFPKPGDSIRIDLTNIEPNIIYKTDNKENSIRENLEESTELGAYVHVNKSGVKKKVDEAEQIFVNESDVKKNCSIPSYIVRTKEKHELILTLHPDTRFEDSDLKKLHQLPAEVLLKIFSSMLLERKVILISSMISKLSSCIDSLQSILYPFTWHHTCIPILPEALWDIVESPTPVICGVLSNDVLNEYQIENGIVVDLDSGTVKKEEGDENKILSSSMQKVWRRSLALANKAGSSKEYVHSVYLSDAYLQVFIMCFKDYKKFLKDNVFQKEEFLKHGKSKSIKRFLKMFTETYMFLAFIDTVLNSPDNLLEFDKKIEMYGSEDSNVILDKLLEWNR